MNTETHRIAFTRIQGPVIPPCMVCATSHAAWTIWSDGKAFQYVCDAHLATCLPQYRTYSADPPLPADEPIETKEHTPVRWPTAAADPEALTVRDAGEGGVAGHPPYPPNPDPAEDAPADSTDGTDDPQIAVQAARRRLAEEWQAADPRTADDIARFYQTAAGLGDDLDAWHHTPARQAITAMVVHVAQQMGARVIVDIGCGAGHDLRALRDQVPFTDLCGHEPNGALREALIFRHGIHCVPSLALAPLEIADLLICIDVLEHLPDPEAFLTDVATRARVGTYLFEAVATHDAGTPLHLVQNRGWHPGHVLEALGWELRDTAMGRVHVWCRVAQEGRPRTGLLLCAYRAVNAATMQAILHVCAPGHEQGWRLRMKNGDGMISRSRGILTTAWWRETADDVALMIDDDVEFSPEDAEHIAELVRSGLDIVCGAYPVHDGGHLAGRMLPGGGETLAFGPGQDPVEIEYAATGFLAFSRRVIAALVPDLPLQHGDQSWSYYNLFPFLEVENPRTGCSEVLSEDWSFCELARRKGFHVWLDRTIILRHASTLPVSVRNMDAIHEAIKQA